MVDPAQKTYSQASVTQNGRLIESAGPRPASIRQRMGGSGRGCPRHCPQQRRLQLCKRCCHRAARSIRCGGGDCRCRIPVVAVKRRRRRAGRGVGRLASRSTPNRGTVSSALAPRSPAPRPAIPPCEATGTPTRRQQGSEESTAHGPRHREQTHSQKRRANTGWREATLQLTRDCEHEAAYRHPQTSVHGTLRTAFATQPHQSEGNKRPTKITDTKPDADASRVVSPELLGETNLCTLTAGRDQALLQGNRISNK